eukprot:752839-Hanusia_phi.AAC.5
MVEKSIVKIEQASNLQSVSNRIRKLQKLQKLLYLCLPPTTNIAHCNHESKNDAKQKKWKSIVRTSSGRNVLRQVSSAQTCGWMQARVRLLCGAVQCKVSMREGVGWRMLRGGVLATSSRC